MMLTDLADVLRAAGLPVVEVPGWKTRGYLGQQMSGVRAIVTHWTGTNLSAKGDYPTLNTILSGNSGTPGPLSQLGLGRGGTWHVCAAGLCNHAGVVDHPDHSNPWAIGIEAEYHPDQGPWPEVQQRSYERGCAALAKAFGVPVDQIRGHYEVARPMGRKSDPNTLPGGMAGFRQRVGAILNGDDMFEGPDRVKLDRMHAFLAESKNAPGGQTLHDAVWRNGDQLARLHGVMQSQAAALAALATNRNITPEQLTATVDKAVDGAMDGLAEQLTASLSARLLAEVAPAMRDVLGADNADQAARVVDELQRRLSDTAGAEGAPTT